MSGDGEFSFSASCEGARAMPAAPEWLSSGSMHPVICLSGCAAILGNMTPLAARPPRAGDAIDLSATGLSLRSAEARTLRLALCSVLFAQGLDTQDGTPVLCHGRCADLGP